jgi:hypothetical protein
MSLPLTLTEARTNAARVERRRLSRNARGECRLRMDGDQLFIERADAEVWLEDSFLLQVAGPKKQNQWVDVMWQPFDQCDPKQCCQQWRNGHCFYGALVTIRAVNGTAIYRVGRYMNCGMWEARRADL